MIRAPATAARGGRPIEAVIFDLDGVLVDTTPLHAQVWDEWFDTVPYAPPGNDVRNVLGVRGEDVITSVSDGAITEARAHDIVDDLYDRIGELVSARPPPVHPAATAVLDQLEGRGLRLALATSSRRRNAERLAGRLWDRFPVTVTAEDVAEGKPSPEVFLTAARALGTPPARCLVVEDATAGVEAARAAGMCAIAVPGTASREKLLAAGACTVATLDALPALTGRLAAG